jgi:hypothetical protein
MRGVLVVCLVAGVATRGGAQSWRSGDQLELIRRAVAQRVERDADTLLASWQAEAHGVLRYASVLDHGDGPVERVIRADELRVEVYGEAPNRSKQIIVEWRDSTFLPNRLSYHRDHLGIVANDFGSTIRLGQGEEVRDVPHPLSAAGLAVYQFAIGDTLTLAATRGALRVVSIQVRPLHPDSMGTVGTLYLDLERAALVRFRFTFTPASYRDHTVEDITVTLENALQQNTRWLPWRQSIVIRRGIAWLDLPVHSVIRADWTIEDYQLGLRHPATRFTGAFIDGPRVPQSGAAWDTTVALSLRDLPHTDADVALVRRAASEALGRELRGGLPGGRIAGAGISDFIRVNRVEGVTPAIGARLALGHGMSVTGRAGIGLSDNRFIGSFSLAKDAGVTHWSLAAERLLADVGDVAVISGLANSLSTAIGGDDFGDYTLVERVMGGLRSVISGTRVALEAGREWSWSVGTAFRPLSGDTRANPSLGVGATSVVRAGLSRRDLRGFGWVVNAEAGDGGGSWARIHAVDRGRIAMPSGELQVTGEVGAGTRGLPGYREFVSGGRGTLLGVPFRALGGSRMARMEIAWSLPAAVPTPPFPYARYAPLPSTVAPFVAAGVVGGDDGDAPWRATGRIEPVAGLRLDLCGPLIRLEGGVSVRTGRVALTVDVHPDWWGMM